MALKKSSDVAVGGSLPEFFRPADHESAVALLVEPYNLREDVPTTNFDGDEITEDRIEATVTIFRTEDELTNGRQLTKNFTFTHKGLVNNLKPLLEDGDAIVGIVRKKSFTTKAGKKAQAYNFVDVDVATEEKVVAYFEARDEELPEELR